MAPSENRLLIVDDDPATTRRLRRVFEAKGWQVVAVATLADAMVALKSLPDLIFLALALPDGDGEILLRQIRESGLASCVAITSDVDDPARLGRLLPFKPDLVIPKPIHFARLLDACHRIAEAPRSASPLDMTA